MQINTRYSSFMYILPLSLMYLQDKGVLDLFVVPVGATPASDLGFEVLDVDAVSLWKVI